MSSYRGFVFIAVLAALLFSHPSNSKEHFVFSADVPSMIEEAATAGLVQSYTGPWEYFVGGGVAGFDCNGDRMSDLFIAGGTDPAKMFINRSLPGGKLQFTPVKIAADDNLLTKVLGAYPINIDNDEYLDLIVLRLGKNLILKGGPDCTFTLANDKFAFDGGKNW